MQWVCRHLPTNLMREERPFPEAGRVFLVPTPSCGVNREAKTGQCVDIAHSRSSYGMTRVLLSLWWSSGQLDDSPSLGSAGGSAASCCGSCSDSGPHRFVISWSLGCQRYLPIQWCQAQASAASDTITSSLRVVQCDPLSKTVVTFIRTEMPACKSSCWQSLENC